MNRVVYIICPGWMESKNDEQFHWIGVDRLRKLYGITDKHDARVHPQTQGDYHGWNPPPGAVYLRPRYNGNYSEVPVYETDTRNQ